MSIEKKEPVEEPLEKDAEGQTSELTAEEADKVAGAGKYGKIA
jgi:hypothetical protein